MKISHAREKRQGRGREGWHPGESAGAAREAVHTELGDPAGQDGRPAPGPREAHLAPRPWAVPPAPTCLVFFFPKFLMYMSYSFTGGRSKRENVNEKSRSMSRSSFALRVL